MNREPLGKLALLVAAVAGLLVAFGINITADQVDALTTLISVAGPVIGPLIVWRLGRKRVTPLDDPRDDEGNALVADAGEVSALFVLTVVNTAMLVYLCLKALGAI